MHFFGKIMLISQIFSIERMTDDHRKNHEFSQNNRKKTILSADIDRDRMCKNNENFCRKTNYQIIRNLKVIWTSSALNGQILRNPSII